MRTFYRDDDGDSFGAPATALDTCNPPEGYVSVAGDCHDDDNWISPAAPEVPGNGVDEDCSGADAPLDETTSLFVATTGDDLAAGSRSAPLRTLAAATALAAVDGRAIAAATGTYAESVELNTSLYGGFTATTWAPDYSGLTTTITGQGPVLSAISTLPAWISSIEVISSGGTVAIQLDGTTHVIDCTVNITGQGVAVQNNGYAIVERTTILIESPADTVVGLANSGVLEAYEVSISTWLTARPRSVVGVDCRGGVMQGHWLNIDVTADSAAGLVARGCALELSRSAVAVEGDSVEGVAIFASAYTDLTGNRITARATSQPGIAVLLSETDDAWLVNNALDASGAVAIAVAEGVNAAFFNNTVVSTSDAAVKTCIGGCSGGVHNNLKFVNNILVGSNGVIQHGAETVGVYVNNSFAPGPSCLIDALPGNCVGAVELNLCAWPGCGASQDNLVADPMLTADGSFHLEAGSPCVDSGADPADWGCEVTDDFEEDSRPSGLGWDIGADEAL